MYPRARDVPTHKAALNELSITQLAELTGQAKETVSKRLRARGLQPSRVDGRTMWFDPRIALAVLLGGGSQQAEKERLDAARADLYELELEEKRKELIPRADHQRALIALATATATRLDAVPARVAPEVAIESDPATCQAIVARYIHAAREDLAAAGEEAARALAREDAGTEEPRRRGRGIRGDASAAEPQRSRVGRAK